MSTLEGMLTRAMVFLSLLGVEFLQPEAPMGGVMRGIIASKTAKSTGFWRNVAEKGRFPALGTGIPRPQNDLADSQNEFPRLENEFSDSENGFPDPNNDLSDSESDSSGSDTDCSYLESDFSDSHNHFADLEGGSSDSDSDCSDCCNVD